MNWDRALPFLLLVGSNVFMTFAWYGHLRYKNSSIFIAILASWLIAGFEYLLQVPANRLGHENFSATQLKLAQEVISISVFIVFALLYLGEQPRWNHLVAFACIGLAVFFTFAWR